MSISKNSVRWLWISFLLAGCIWYTCDIWELRMSDREIRTTLAKNPLGYTAEISYFSEMGRDVRYVEIGQDSLPLIVFVHGAPSSSSFWVDLLKDSLLLSRAKLLAVDRPGYGYSNFGQTMISVEEQARLISKVIRKKREQHCEIVVHGSSYGGTVAARIAMDYPELVDGLLLQSASMAPGAEKTYDISHVVRHRPLIWLVPPAIRNANREKLSHRLQLQKMADRWHRIRSGVIIMHGDADRLIYPDNAIYAAKRLVNAACLDFQMFPGRRHDLLWTKTQELKASLVKLLLFVREHSD